MIHGAYLRELEDDPQGYDGLFIGHVAMTSHHPDTSVTKEPDAASLPLYPPTRYCDRPMDWRSRLFGIAGTTSVAVLLVGGALFSWTTYQVVTPPVTLSVFDVTPPAAPPDPVREVPEGAEQVEQKEQKPEEQVDQAEPHKIVIPQLAAPVVPAALPVEAFEPARAVAATTAPKSLPAPPANRASNNVKASWEALLLAHLERYRRYPAAARSRREEGIAVVTFSMNRAGVVLSARIVRSSGSAILDRAALDTLRRAQPLPKIPDDRPDTLEFSVPVEFFVHR